MSLLKRYCIIVNRLKIGSEIVATFNIQKIKGIKKKVVNSNIILTARTKITRVTIIIAVVAAVVIIAIVGIFMYRKYKSYDDYKVLSSMNIESGSNSKYLQYCDFVVKYSSDGISYIDSEGTVWDASYQMKSPIIDICDEYIAVADKNTNDIYIYDKDGNEGKVTTSYPIIKVEIAKQGVVVALLEDRNANYIEVFDREGNKLVSHKTLLDENGYPVDFSLSESGEKMAVSYIKVNNGAMANKIVFYNFSKAGKNSENRVVGTFDQYKDVIVPMVKFTSENDVIAVGENVLSIYEMRSKVSLNEDIKIKDEIQKAFYSDEYVGFVLKNSNSRNPYRLEVYNLGGSRVMKKEIAMSYDNVSFAGKNVLMYDDMNCQIISFDGVKKYKHTFRGEINSIIPVDGSNTFLFMTNSKIQKVKLK